jgi:Ca-activated chloride channel homolog
MNLIQKLFFILFLFQVLSLQAQQVKREIRKGNREYADGKYSDAELSYRKAIEKDPQSEKAIYNLGNALYKQDQFESSVAKYECLLEKEKDPVVLAKYYYNLGNSYFKSQKLEKSIEAYKQSLRLNPSDVDAKHNLFLAQNMLKQQQSNDKQSKPREPSEFAKKLKEQADKLVAQGKFVEAYNLMLDGLKKDASVGYYQDFIDKTGKVAAIIMKL